MISEMLAEECDKAIQCDITGYSLPGTEPATLITRSRQGNIQVYESVCSLNGTCRAFKKIVVKR